MGKSNYTLTFLKKLSQFFKRNKRKFKEYILNSMAVFHCILNVFGLNISPHISNLRKNLVWVCQKFAILCIISLMMLMYPTIVNLGVYTKFGIKSLLSFIVVEGSSYILWCVMFFSQKKMAHINNYIIKLQKAIKTPQSDGFTSIFIIYTILIYIFSVICEFYPFTDDRYDKLLSYFFIPNTGNKYLTREIVFILYSIYHAFIDLLPQCFINLYITLCHHMHTILILYIKKINATIQKSETRILKWFDYYQSVVNAFESFEKVFALSIFVVFSKSVVDIFFNVMYIYGNAKGLAVEACRIAVNFISITSITLMASQLSETDKIAKAINLQHLEVLLKINKHLQLDKFLRIWKLNNSRPCTLTAWGFFNFSKGLYLNTISILITYSLLVLHL